MPTVTIKCPVCNKSFPYDVASNELIVCKETLSAKNQHIAAMARHFGQDKIIHCKHCPAELTIWVLANMPSNKQHDTIWSPSRPLDPPTGPPGNGLGERF